jgi:hypothetical protein
MAGMNQHGYIMTVPTFNFTVLGAPMRSATEVRAMFAKADEATQQRIIKDLFGAYDEQVHDIMKNNIKEDAAGVGVIASPRYKNSLTVDVQPGTQRKMMRALRLI